MLPPWLAYLLSEERFGRFNRCRERWGCCVITLRLVWLILGTIWIFGNGTCAAEDEQPPKVYEVAKTVVIIAWGTVGIFVTVCAPALLCYPAASIACCQTIHTLPWLMFGVWGTHRSCAACFRV